MLLPLEKRCVYFKYNGLRRLLLFTAPQKGVEGLYVSALFALLRSKRTLPKLSALHVTLCSPLSKSPLHTFIMTWTSVVRFWAGKDVVDLLRYCGLNNPTPRPHPH